MVYILYQALSLAMEDGMQQSDDTGRKNEQIEIVKLTVAGMELPVNTIQHQNEDGRISLLCPFPALEVDIPVHFTGKDGKGVQNGTIQRIKVEEDRETGLPRLKLSIDTRHDPGAAPDDHPESSNPNEPGAESKLHF